MLPPYLAAKLPHDRIGLKHNASFFSRQTEGIGLTYNASPIVRYRGEIGLKHNTSSPYRLQNDHTTLMSLVPCWVRCWVGLSHC